MDNLNSENKQEEKEKSSTHQKEKYKKKFQQEISVLENLNKEEIMKEYVKLLSEEKKLSELITEREKESTEYLDRYRRALAETENTRKRFIQERQEILKYSNFNVITDLLTVLDDFERATLLGKTTNLTLENFIQGIEMIEKQLQDLLFKKYGVEKYGKEGDEFDPNIHNAISVTEGDFDKETIGEIFRSGYKLHDRIIRPAEVKVNKPL
jgi:molecular chaperone GrpE